MKFTLKGYQADAVRDALENLKKARKDWHVDAYKNAFSLTAVTGAGKTVTSSQTRLLDYPPSRQSPSTTPKLMVSFSMAERVD